VQLIALGIGAIIGAGIFATIGIGLSHLIAFVAGRNKEV
jgi:amino acid transporter